MQSRWVPSGAGESKEVFLSIAYHMLPGEKLRCINPETKDYIVEHKEPAFTVSDRRHTNPEYEAPVEVPKPVIVEKKPEGLSTEWKSLGYVCCNMKMQDGNLIMVGKAIGLRGDGVSVSVDYLLPPVWPSSLNWVKVARERLDSYLGCECTKYGHCPYHALRQQEWVRSDMERLNIIANMPMPEALELWFRANQAAQATQPKVHQIGRR